MRKTGNIEAYLTYSKLHRTGRLLRGLKMKVVRQDNSAQITLYNKVRYASEHETGKSTGGYKTIKKPYVHNGASGATLGGNITQRSFMKPSTLVLLTPQRLLEERLQRFGWGV